jgi:hypothetical protein
MHGCAPALVISDREFIQRVQVSMDVSPNDGLHSVPFVLQEHGKPMVRYQDSRAQGAGLPGVQHYVGKACTPTSTLAHTNMQKGVL